MILANILYYISVTFGVIQSLSSTVSFRHTISPLHATLPTKLQREYINRKDMPLPYICMVLSNVMLHMHFVGQAIKYGAQWMPFTKYLHNIGMNGMVNAQASHTKFKQIGARRISTLLGILTASTCMLSAQALNISTNMAFVFQHNATFRIHDADNPKPLRQGSYIDTNMRSMSSTPINHIPDNTELCMVATKLALQSKVDWEQSRNTFNFIPTNTEFGTYNCATQHICGLEDLFIHMREPASPIGVKGISGVSTAKGIGSIRFTLKDDQQTTHTITLNDVIYPPGAVKNLISISQWSKDKQDNCAILSRGSYSIFLWNHDKHSKVIEHSPDCAIPMMPVNEQADKFALFADKHAVKFDSIPPVSIENQLFEITSLNPEHIDRKTTDKQSKVEPIDAPRNPASNSNKPGDTVRVWDDGKWKIAIVDEVRRSISDNSGYLVRLLNSPKKIFVPSSSIRGFHPDPSDFPSNPSEVDTKELTHTLTKEELRQLWAPSTDDTISPESRITLY